MIAIIDPAGSRAAFYPISADLCGASAIKDDCGPLASFTINKSGNYLIGKAESVPTMMIECH
jgi:hypothetical protein